MGEDYTPTPAEPRERSDSAAKGQRTGARDASRVRAESDDQYLLADAQRNADHYEREARRAWAEVRREDDRATDAEQRAAKAEADRDAIAVVLERVRAYLAEGKGAYAPDLHEILSAAPDEMLREHDITLINRLSGKLTRALVPDALDEQSGAAARDWLLEQVAARRRD